MCAITSKDRVRFMIVPFLKVIVDKYVVGHSTLNFLFLLDPTKIILLLAPLTMLPERHIFRRWNSKI